MKRCTKTMPNPIKVALLTLAVQFMSMLFGIAIHPFIGFAFGYLGMGMILTMVFSYIDRPKRKGKK